MYLEHYNDIKLHIIGRYVKMYQCAVKKVERDPFGASYINAYYDIKFQRRYGDCIFHHYTGLLKFELTLPFCIISFVFTKAERAMYIQMEFQLY